MSGGPHGEIGGFGVLPRRFADFGRHSVGQEATAFDSAIKVTKRPSKRFVRAVHMRRFLSVVAHHLVGAITRSL